jgi:outer membrane protein
VLLLVGITAHAQSGDSLVVEQVIQVVLKAQPTVRQDQASQLVADARVSQSRSGYYPRASITGAYTHLDPVGYIQVPGADGQVSNLTLNPHNNYSAQFAVQYTLLDFGRRRSSLALAQSQQASAAQQLRLTKQNLAFETVNHYYTILFLQRALAVQDQQLAALLHNLAQTERRAANGTATRFDLLTTQTRIAAVKNEQIQLRNDIDRQQIQLRSLMGRPASQPLALSGRIDAPAFPNQPDSLLAQAYRQRVEVQLSRVGEEAARLQTVLAGQNARPTLNVYANGGTANGYQPNINRMRGTFQGGVNLNVPVFTGYQNHYQQAEARAGQQVATARTDEARRLVRVDVEQSLNMLQALDEKLRNTQVQVTQAQEAARRARISYANQLVTNLDLLNSEVALAAAQNDYLQALFNRKLATYDLQRAIGTPLYQ